MIAKYKLLIKRLFATSILVVVAACSFGAVASAAQSAPAAPVHYIAGKTCGAGDEAYTTMIDLGCVGKGNPIMDATFAVIRFLSYGVGLVLIGSLIFAGMQYTTSRGDPKSTAAAMTRIKSTVGALILFIFGFAVLNYIVPAGILQ